MDGKGVCNRSSQVQAVASGLFFTFDTPVILGYCPSRRRHGYRKGVPTFSGKEMRVPLTSAANEKMVDSSASRRLTVEWLG